MMEQPINEGNTFTYAYSARENAEVQKIRIKYLPQQESKLDELKRLDNMVQTSGVVEALCAGIGGVLLFGLGLCLAMQIIASGVTAVISGVLVGVLGVVGMFYAYPVYRRKHSAAKEKYTPRILELTEELSGSQSETL